MIKIIILYFIQIRHSDDFPSMGIPASSNNDNENYQFFIIVFKQYLIHNLQVVYIYLLRLHGNDQFRQFLLSLNLLALGHNDPQ